MRGDFLICSLLFNSLYFKREDWRDLSSFKEDLGLSNGLRLRVLLAFGCVVGGFLRGR